MADLTDEPLLENLTEVVKVDGRVLSILRTGFALQHFRTAIRNAAKRSPWMMATNPVTSAPKKLKIINSDALTLETWIISHQRSCNFRFAHVYDENGNCLETVNDI